MSWNVQGIHTKLKQHDFIKFCNSFDIFACSEIHNCSKKLMEEVFYNYNVCVSYRKNHLGGGIAVFILKSLNYVTNEISIDLNECIVLKLDKRYLNIDNNLICCFPYIPHEYSTVFSGNLIKGMERFIELYDTLNLKFGDVYWFFGGDFNARTGNLSDFIQPHNVQEYTDVIDGSGDLFDILSCKPRKTRDPNFINTFGRQLVEFCKANNLYILNGRTGSDKKGNITCIANKGKTIVDYFIVSKNVFDLVTSFDITPRPESDHFPLSVVFSGFNDSYPIVQNDFDNNNTCYDSIDTLMWNFKFSNEYKNKFNILLNDINENFSCCLDNNDVNAANDMLNNCINKASQIMQNKPKFSSKNAISQPKWWDNTLTKLKQDKYNFF